MSSQEVFAPNAVTPLVTKPVISGHVGIGSILNLSKAM
jgi:hypothetical protein